MAECTFARCVQERRAIKKELQRWARNIPLVLGCERIAEEYMGLERWLKYQDRMYQGLLTDGGDGEDWEPEEKCNFCDGKSTAETSLYQSESSESSAETSPLPPSGLSPSLESLVAPLNAALSSQLTSLSAAAAVAALSAAAASSSTGVPACFLPRAHSNRSAAYSFFLPSQLDGLKERVAMVDGDDRADAEEQPLDLSAKSRDAEDHAKASLRVPCVDNKSIFRAKPRMSATGTRKTYTEEELQAALRDIQSGKLGTRRAAVIYGIPRSTLRNKVYKLAMERERDNHLQKNLPTVVVAEEVEEDSTASASSSEPRHTPDLGKTSAASESLKSFLAKKQQKKNSAAPKERPPLLPELIKRMTEERLGGSSGIHDEVDEASPSASSNSSVILRIPSFRPTTKNGAATNGVDVPPVVKVSSQNVISAATKEPRRPVKPKAAKVDDKPTGKGTRPKRGKYRNYNRDNLMQAVRAVQRGEMSVHRAGSYYGVPHSTLEYKVKERHLLRPRKREAKKTERPAKKASNGVKVPPPLFDPTLSHLNYPFPFPFWPPPPSSFVPVGYASSEPAAASEEQNAFLDGLIRVSLDSASKAASVASGAPEADEEEEEEEEESAEDEEGDSAVSGDENGVDN